MPPIQDPNKLKEIAAQQSQMQGQGTTLAGPPSQPMPMPGAAPPRAPIKLVNPYRDATVRQADERIDQGWASDARAAEANARSAEANARERERLEREKTADRIRGGPNTTEEERKAAGLAFSMQNSWGLIQEIQKENPQGVLPTMREVLGGATGSDFIRDASIPAPVREQRMNLNNLYRNFIQKAIYAASGAAFQEAELTALTASLAPNYWDTPKTMEVKRRMIEGEIGAAMFKAGAAKEAVQAAIDTFRSTTEDAFKPIVRGDLNKVGEERELDTGEGAKTSVEIPPEMQKEFGAFMQQQTPGKLDIGQFVEAYTTIAQKHGFDKNVDLPLAKKYVDAFNEGRPISNVIPVSERDKGVLEDALGGIASSPTGTAAKEFTSAATLGLPELLAGEEGQIASRLANEANPKAAFAGAVAGSIAPTVALEKTTASLLGKLGIKEGTRAYRLGSDIIANALAGGLTEGNKAGGDVGEYGQGAAFGAGGATVGRAIGKGIKEFKSKEVRDSIEALGEQPIFDDAGEQIGKIPPVDLTTPQRTGATRGEEFVEGFPGIAGARQGATDDWNRFTSARVLARVGRTLPKDVRPGQAANDFVHEALNEEYMKIAPAIVGKVDANFMNQFDAIKTTALGTRPATADPGIKEMWSHLEDATKKFTKGKKFDYKSYKEYTQQIREWQMYWASSKTGTDEMPSPVQNEMARRANLLIQAARGLVARNNPDAAKKLAKIDEAWRHQMVNDLASLGPAKQNRGVFAPAERLNAVERMDFSKRKTATSRGKAFEQAETQDAMDVLGKKPSRGGSVIGTGALGYTVGGAVLSPALIATYFPGVKRLTQFLTDGRAAGKLDNATIKAMLKDPKQLAAFKKANPFAAELPSTLVKQILASSIREEGTGE